MIYDSNFIKILLTLFTSVFLCFPINHPPYINKNIDPPSQLVSFTKNKPLKENELEAAAPVLDSRITYNVKTMEDLKTKLNDAISSCLDSITLNYIGTTALPDYPSCLSLIINDVLQTAGSEYEKTLLNKWSYSYSLPATPEFKVTYSFTYLETAEQRLAVTNKVNDILSSIIIDGMTDDQKEKVIYDYILSNVTYDVNLIHHSAYAALFGDKKTVCQGYALLAYKMLTNAGFDVRIVTGTASGIPHAWNLIKLHGNWYHLDCTWEDTLPNPYGAVQYNFFNLQDGKMKTQAHLWDVSKYPVADTLYPPLTQIPPKNPSTINHKSFN